MKRAFMEAVLSICRSVLTSDRQSASWLIPMNQSPFQSPCQSIISNENRSRSFSHVASIGRTRLSAERSYGMRGLLESNREAWTTEEIGGGLVQTDEKMSIKLNVVTNKVSDTRVNVVLR